jgi:hypothetical protein
MTSLARLECSREGVGKPATFIEMIVCGGLNSYEVALDGSVRFEKVKASIEKYDSRLCLQVSRMEDAFWVLLKSQIKLPVEPSFQWLQESTLDLAESLLLTIA